MSKLTERQSRIQKRLESSLTQIDYTNYIQQLKLQRINYPTKSKLYASFPLNINSTTSLPSLDTHIKEVLRDNYYYTGVVAYNKLLYSLEDFNLFGILGTGIIYYYEFILTSNMPSTSLSQWRYIYIPLALGYRVQNKLPKIRTWDKNGVGLNNPFEHHLVTIKESALLYNSSEVKLTTQEDSHPLLPNFYFTGYTFQWGDGSITYAYFDSKGYYGIQDAVYLSNLRPNLVGYPLGQVFEGDLTQRPALNSLIGQYPEYGEEPWYGSFLGYQTTTQYSSKFTYYLYKQHNTQKTFLSLAPPSKQAKSILAPYLNP